MTQSPSFALCLATSAAPEALAEWLDEAAPRSRVVYATGLDLPTDAPGVQLVTRWKDADQVATFRQRDPLDRRRWQFIAEKRGVGVPSDGGDLTGKEADTQRSMKTRRQLENLFTLLKAQARRRRKCPSLRQLADEMGLGGSNRGRQRARYLLDLLVSDGRLRLGDADRLGQREITIVREKARG